MTVPPDPAETARARLAEASAAFVAGVRSHGGPYLVARTARLLDAWGRLDGDERAAAEGAVARAAAEATERVAGELDALFALDVAQQRTTPSAIVRTIVAEPTAVLRDLGVPPVERDAFAQRHDPDDAYDLVPADLSALGGADLAAVHVVWGLAKVALLRREA